MAGADKTVHLSVDPDRHGELMTGNLVISTDSGPLTLALTVPAGPTTTEDVLPVLQGLSNLFVQRAAARAAATGREVSCRAGCTACCHHIVPVAPSEQRNIAALVKAMPEPRQGEVRGRFAAALSRVADAGLAGKLDDPETATSAELGLAYFGLRIPCPFLETGKCSIYADRPLTCREHTVTTPAEHCEDPGPDRIAVLTLEWRVARALVASERPEGWVPLILSLRDGEAPSPVRTGPEILGGIVAQVGK